MKKAQIIFVKGRQAVLLPEEFQFEDVDFVSVRRDSATGDLVLSDKAGAWADFDASRIRGSVPADFMADRDQTTETRDPFEGLEDDAADTET